MPKIKVVFTGDVTDDEHVSMGATRANGYVSPEWSMTELYENESDVQTFEFDTQEEAEKFIEETIGATETTDGERFYTLDVRTNGDDYWNYCGHTEVVE